jgi:hypothetical protein
VAIHADKIMLNIQTSKYPFVEGDEYYTLGFGQDAIEPTLSVWDDESEVIHDANPNQTYYFVFADRLWKKQLRFPNQSSSPDGDQYYYSVI